jgi:MOSC domain-containing protein YiiM
MVIDSGHTGFYFRVLEEGTAKKGDKLVLKERDSHNINVPFANHILHHDNRNCHGIDKVLSVPALSESWQHSLQKLKERCK